MILFSSERHQEYAPPTPNKTPASSNKEHFIQIVKNNKIHILKAKN